jgi:hypothetical protein
MPRRAHTVHDRGAVSDRSILTRRDFLAGASAVVAGARSWEFDGAAGSDRTLLALGVAVEQVLGTGPPPRN